LYDIGEELGRGAFSVVRLAVNKKDGSKWAVKIIDKKSAGQDMDRLETEIEILKKVSHPNIICLKDIYDTKTTFYIVTELVTGGELFDKIVEVGNYSEKDAAVLVQKMLSAIGYLHSLGIVHRDLKPENLLLKDGSDISEVKLADFGLSKIVGQKVMMQTACGTPGYVAPEVLQAQGYGPEVDLWSIGVITYILLCGFPPFYHEELPELFEQIMSADFDFPEEYWDSVSGEAKDFIKKLLVVKPAERLSVDAALNHPWIRGQAGSGKIKGTFANKMKEYTTVRRQQSKVNAQG
jgi:calcium/calmodulin-dependent protein kinase I